MVEDNPIYHQRSIQVRSELKAWEHDFLSSNGKKPSRKDVATNVTIASKYKEYENLRAILAGKAPPHSQTSPRKRKAADNVTRTPSKKRAPKVVVSTPRKSSTQEVEGTAVDFTPQPPKPTMIGPTPQRDGIFIGIFDNLPAETPSRNRTILGDADTNALHTPSKILATPEHIHTQARHSRTPMSVGKRFMLDQYVTPGKRKAAEEGTPSTLSKRFMTPAFLRRDTSALEVVAEDESEQTQPRRSGWQRPIIMRSLSSMIKSLRQEEDEKLDDDLELLREMESEDEPTEPKTTSAVERSSLKSRDSGVGFDQQLDQEGFLNYDVGEEIKQVNEAEAAKAEEEGQPKRVWKKRGQKRQTKRGNMRPTRGKPQQAHQDVTSDVENDADEDAVSTKDSVLPTPDQSGGKQANSGDEESAYDLSEEEDDAPKPTKAKAKGNRSKKPEPAQSPKKAVRKINPNAQSHTNYQRLKIRGKNARPNGRSRFGKRR